MRNYIEHFSILSRRNKIALQLALDTILLAISFLGAMLFRLESLDFVGQPAIWGAFLSSITATLLAFWGLGLYRVVVRFITGRILITIGKGAVVAAISLYATGTVFDASIPRSVPIIFAVFAFLSVGGLRFAARTYLRNSNHLNKRPVIIYGAGEAGLQLLNALFHGQEFAPVALVDDDPSLQNLGIGGLRV